MDEVLLARIRRMANSDDWEVREKAAVEIKEVNDKYFEEYFPRWKRWARDNNPNIRRAVEVGLLRIKKEHYKKSLQLLTPLLRDPNKYVRKNCGPFALSAVAFRDHKASFRKFRELIQNTDKNLRWNIAVCLGVMFGVKYPKESLKLLRVLAKDKRRFVWGAAASSLIKLVRRDPKLQKTISSWKGMDECLAVVKKYRIASR
ncbi:MAG: hypothetical protein A3C11_03435 [Candidatus Sungbacteria bacterium RIFCSPHIGHO2_02_FULL_49_12]|uniref:HEAT repeat domain-containing protein n=1 Tax=Candidatus Sungbacteria bacterium RIFCSPHIGHO2_02_FULL_49_12 TaxID=1802271 RepID=A0A1G2KT67_9BACT|nr:MAG: hypothetical protein A3C11_03435 [Candidatus Sungbacteria bacterium RIFCSPHIGHO2_02_FULL_49_12]